MAEKEDRQYQRPENEQGDSNAGRPESKQPKKEREIGDKKQEAEIEATKGKAKRKPVLSPAFRKAQQQLTKIEEQLIRRGGFGSYAEAHRWLGEVAEEEINWSSLSQKETKKILAALDDLKKQAGERVRAVELPKDPEKRKEYLQNLIEKEERENPLSKIYGEWMEQLPLNASEEQRKAHAEEFFERHRDEFERSGSPIEQGRWQRIDLANKLLEGLSDQELVEWMERVGMPVIEGGSGAGAIKDLLANFGLVFGQYREAARAYPLGPEAILLDARREILQIAIDKASERGGKIEVKEEDMEEWMMERLQEVINVDQEGAAYYARQNLMPVYAVLAAKELKFGEILKGLISLNDSQLERLRHLGVDEDGLRRIQTSLREHREYWQEGEESKEQGTGHVDAVSTDLKERIAAAMIWNDARVAYGMSTLASYEPLMRRLKLVDVGSVLELRGKRIRIKGRVGFTLTKTRKPWSRRWLGDKKHDWEEARTVEHDYDDTHTEVIADEAMLELRIDGGKWETKSLASLENLLAIDEEVALQVATSLDLINQERIFDRILRRNEDMAEAGRFELTRQSILVELGAIDVDGRINKEVLEKLIIAQYRADKGVEPKKVEVRFRGRKSGKLIEGREEDLLRAHLIVEEYGQPNKRMKKVALKKGEEGKGFEYLIGYKRDEKTKKYVKCSADEAEIFRTVAWEEDFADIDREFSWARKLSEGIWRLFGVASAQDKDFSGNTLDWHTKILQFPRYCKMYGIGAILLREVVSTEYTDFITRRLTELFPGLKPNKKMFEEIFKERTGWREKKKKTRKKEIALAVDLLLKDFNGFFMSRDRLLKMFEVYHDLKANKGEQEAERFIRERLLSSASYIFGRSHGEMFVNRVWDDLLRLDWGKMLSSDDRQSLAAEGESLTGLNGLYWLIREEYFYKKFNWKKAWNERPYKEGQYTVAADASRKAMIGWINGDGPKKFEALKAPILAAAWYGMRDVTTKGKQMAKQVVKYFSQHILGIVVPERDDWDWTNVSPEEKEEFFDPIDGTLDKNYLAEYKGPFWMPAAQDYHNYSVKMSLDDKKFLVNRMAGSMMLRTDEDYHELMADTTGLGDWLPYRPAVWSAAVVRKLAPKPEMKWRRGAVKAALFALGLPAWLLVRHEVEIPHYGTIKISNAEVLVRLVRGLVGLGWQYKGAFILGIFAAFFEELKKEFNEAMS